MYGYLQKLGKSLMLPVAVMPICAILMGVGYILDPSTMVKTAEPNDIVIVHQIAFLLTSAGSAIINNIAILFAIGVGVGMSKNNDGTGAVSALVCWLVITVVVTSYSAGVGNIDTSDGLWAIFKDLGDLVTIAFKNIQNPFIGILSGCVGAACYNKFKDTKLPDFLAFFSGKRCVAIVSALCGLIIAAILLLVWPFLYLGLYNLGDAIKNLKGVGVGLYMFLNRLLMPVGLHHALNNIFWFDTIGIGDLSNFWAGKTSEDVGWSLGMYMSGFFPCFMFGIPGACLAFILRSKNKKATLGILGSTALCSFLCGITEPFDFTFLFIAFPLYVICSALFGIMGIITYYVGFRAGFSFSGGCIDFVLSSQLPAANNTWMIIPLGIGAFVLFFLVFYLYNVLFKNPIPGEFVEEAQLEDKTREMAIDEKYHSIAKDLLAAVGGKENIKETDHCVTRLRLKLKDIDKVDKDACQRAGAVGVMMPSKDACQIIIGTDVQFVYDAFIDVKDSQN